MMRSIRTVALTAMVAAVCSMTPVMAQSPTLDELVSAVVKVKTYIDPDGRTLRNLGREREGAGIALDDKGLVLTIGYLMVEAYAVEVTTNDGRTVPADAVGYDHETGFGLLRTGSTLKVRPMTFGKSADIKTGDPVVVASFGGVQQTLPARVVARREFAGSWEYLLDDAIFTSPPHPSWGGAALVDRSGRLVGVGSLLVADAAGKGDDATLGNMFVPIDLLSPIMADLLTSGRSTRPARPWLGMTTEESAGRLTVARVATDGPAEKAGVKKGDIVVGVKGATPISLADFYRKVWSQGAAGTTVEIDVQRDGETRRVAIRSTNRYEHLKLKSTF